MGWPTSQQRCRRRSRASMATAVSVRSESLPPLIRLPGCDGARVYAAGEAPPIALPGSRKYCGSVRCQAFQAPRKPLLRFLRVWAFELPSLLRRSSPVPSSRQSSSNSLGRFSEAVRGCSLPSVSGPPRSSSYGFFGFGDSNRHRSCDGVRLYGAAGKAPPIALPGARKHCGSVLCHGFRAPRKLLLRLLRSWAFQLPSFNTEPPALADKTSPTAYVGSSGPNPGPGFVWKHTPPSRPGPLWPNARLERHAAIRDPLQRAP